MDQIYIQLYLLMRPQRNSKLKIMQQCLTQFRQIPTLLETLSKKQTNNNNKIKQLLDCCHKFAELAFESQQEHDDQTVLFYRFFSRIREIINASLTYYLHTGSFIMIRQLLTEINNQILQYKLKVGYSTLLLAISSIIRRFTTKLAHNCSHLEQMPQQLFENQKTIKIRQQQTEQKFYSTQPNYYYKYMEKKNKIKQQEQNTKDKQKKVTSYSWIQRFQKTKVKFKSKEQIQAQQRAKSHAQFTKSLGLDILCDLDGGNLTQLQNNNNSQEMFRQNLNRNKNINCIMKRYQQKYQSYKARPSHRKNRERADYKPTQSPYLSKSCISKTRIKKVPSENSKSKIKPMIQHSLLQVQEQLKRSQEMLKEEFINQLSSYRQKYQLRKVTIGINNMNVERKMYNQTIQQSLKNTKKNLNIMQMQPRLKNHSNRSYISRMTSLPIK